MLFGLSVPDTVKHDISPTVHKAPRRCGMGSLLCLWLAMDVLMGRTWVRKEISLLCIDVLTIFQVILISSIVHPPFNVKSMPIYPFFSDISIFQDEVLNVMQLI